VRKKVTGVTTSLMLLVALTSSLVLAQGLPIPLIFDDDGSPDGTIALMYVLRNPAFELKALTVSCGEAHPTIFAQNLTRVLARVGHSGIPVAAGRELPLSGKNEFPGSWRAQSDGFWGLALPQPVDMVQTLSAAQLIVNVVKASPRPVTLLVTGTHTNVAEALRLDRSIASKIKEIVIMGGALYIPGNIASNAPGYTNTVSEWNIWVDPVAANEVFASGIPLRLAPLDSTDDVVWTSQDATTWSGSGTPEGALAGEILQMLLQWWNPKGIYIWDLDTAVVASNPGVCPGERLHVDVITAAGNQQGRTVVRPGESATVSACLRLDSYSVKSAVRAALEQK
jgi:purine nucleosidase/pyrimidine-specific ribonucleoside hydrolase